MSSARAYVSNEYKITTAAGPTERTRQSTQQHVSIREAYKKGAPYDVTRQQAGAGRQGAGQHGSGRWQRPARGAAHPHGHYVFCIRSQRSSDNLRILAAPGDVIGRVGGRLPRTPPPSISDRSAEPPVSRAGVWDRALYRAPLRAQPSTFEAEADAEFVVFLLMVELAREGEADAAALADALLEHRRARRV